MIAEVKLVSRMRTLVVGRAFVDVRWRRMNKTQFLLLAAAILATIFGTAYAADNPQPVHAGTRILQSGNLIVEVGDPESADCRWNQGLRFSLVANVLQIKLNDQPFCYAPVGGGALGYVGGLPMEFDIGQESFQPDPPGYNEGSNGSAFLKIGVGILTRDSSPYNFSSSYPVVELAQTTTTWESDRVHFVQTLSGTANGYSYKLEEDVIVKNDTLLMVYVLTNTGTKTFTTEQYLHNFLTFSQRSVGPNYRVYFPYDMTASPQVQEWKPPELEKAGRTGYEYVDHNPPMVSLENMILYPKTITSVPKTWIYKPGDYLGPDTIAVEQSDIGQRVIIDSSLRSAYVGIWTTSYQVSPEQFVIVTLAPGERATFTRSYKFSTDGSMAQDCTGDRIVNGNDLLALSSAWLAAPGRADWDPACDVSDPPDDRIDGKDLAALGQVWGHNATDPVPTAHWPLNETTGTVAADNMGAHDGSLVAFSGDDSHWVTGRVDGALEFDGEDDYVEVEGYPGVCGKKPRTVSAWIKTQGIPTARRPIIAWGHDDPEAYWLLEVDEDQRFRVSCGSGFISANEQQVGDGDWHHVSVVLDPVDPERPRISDVLLYVDGERRTIYRMEEANINTGCIENVRIGAAHGPENNTFAGTIDEVAIFDVVVGLTAIHRAYLQ